MIERIIHQVWIQGEKHLPGKYREARGKIAKVNPEFKVMTWSEESFLDLLLDRREEFFLAKYLRITAKKEKALLAKKSDYIRIVVLYIFGGVYMDFDIVPVHSMDRFFSGNHISGMKSKGETVDSGDRLYLSRSLENTYDCFFFREPSLFDGKGRTVSNCIIAAKKETPLLKKLLEDLEERREERVLCFLGPWFLTTRLREIRETKSELFPFLVVPHQYATLSPPKTSQLAFQYHYSDLSWGDWDLEMPWHIS